MPPAPTPPFDDAALAQRIASVRAMNDAGQASDALALAIETLGVPDLPEWALAPLHNHVGMSHFHLGNVEQSLQHVLLALDLWARVDDPKGRISSLTLYTWLMIHVGELDQAVEYGFQALTLAERLNDAASIVLALNALGGAYVELPDQHAVCHQVYERALTLARERGDLHDLIQSLGNLGSAYDRYATRLMENAQTEEARSWGLRAIALSEQTLAIGEQLGNARYCAMAQINIVDTAATIRETARAEPHLESLLARAAAAEDRRLHGYALYAVGHLHLVQDDANAACAVLEKACALAEDANLTQLGMLCRKLLGAACEEAQNYRAALEHFKRYFALREQSSSEAAQRRGRAMAVLHETERAKARAEAEHLRAEALALRNRELDLRAQRFAHDAQHDALTGLYNRRQFDQALSEELEKPQPHLCLALLDIDHFKRINDSYSHLCGDEVLRHLSDVLRQNVRGHDLAFRYGGEEFALLFVGADEETALAACERVRGAVERFDWSCVQAGLSVTVSIGLVRALPRQPAQAVLGLADERLYLAKAKGRNRVVAH